MVVVAVVEGVGNIMKYMVMPDLCLVPSMHMLLYRGPSVDTAIQRLPCALYFIPSTALITFSQVFGLKQLPIHQFPYKSLPKHGPAFLTLKPFVVPSAWK